MHPAPDLAAIVERLRGVSIDPWGPDGTRYVSVVCFDHQGYRALRNVLLDMAWPRWDETSGEFWDLFWAGCYQYGGPNFYGDSALLITEGHTPVRWSPDRSANLIADLETRAAATAHPWRFQGPIELVVVGARRAGAEVDIEWESIRATRLPAERLGTATAAYTESHITLDPEQVGDLPSPGDFADDLPPREVLLAIARMGPRLLRALGLGG